MLTTPMLPSKDHLSLLSQEAPRYTSYPSAHHFGPLEAHTYDQALDALDHHTSIALYVHIPFCEQMCTFCGCHTRATLKYAPISTYVDHVIAEIKSISAKIGFSPSVHSLHFGGGSPSILDPFDMERLISCLEDHFHFFDGAERSIELDPRRVDFAKISLLASLGFNRASLGVQDTDPTVQKAINRVQSDDVVAQTMNDLRKAGIKALGIDLVYGLPHQSRQTIEKTLKAVKGFDPDRIAVFSYAHVPWVKKHQNLIDTSQLPEISEKLSLFDTIKAHFLNENYDAIGMDHFAKPHDGLSIAKKNGTLRRNFMGYTDVNNDWLIGIGASSLGELSSGIFQNIPQTTSYNRLIAEKGSACVRGHLFLGDDRVRKAIISELMCQFRCNVAAVCRQFGLCEATYDEVLDGLHDFEDLGLIRLDGRTISFISPLWMLIRVVAARFDRYIQNKDDQNRYSKVA